MRQPNDIVDVLYSSGNKLYSDISDEVTVGIWSEEGDYSYAPPAYTDAVEVVYATPAIETSELTDEIDIYYN